MKKVKDFLLGLVIPKKMNEMVNIPIYITILILLVCPLISLSTEAITNKQMAIQALDAPSLLETITTDDAVIKGDLTELTISFFNNNLSDNVSNGVYKLEKTVSEKTLDLTVIVINNLSLNDTTKFDITTVFDLEGYLNQDKQENTEYALYVLTKDTVMYVYDLAPLYEDASIVETYGSFIYESDEEGNVKYYLPKDETELWFNEYGDIDITMFTKEVTSDATIDFTLTGQFEGLTINPVKKHQTNLYNALYNDYYEYKALTSNKYNLTKTTTFAEFNNQFINGVIAFTAKQYWTLSFVGAEVMCLLIPLFISLITWYTSKFGKLKKYKNFLNICAFSYLDVAVLSAIVGIWFNYYRYMIFYIGASLVVYMVYVTILTKEPRKDNNNPKEDNQNKMKEKKQQDYDLIG